MEAVDLGEAARVNVRVDLRRADVRMAEHLLDGADVRAVLEQVRGEAVAEDVRRDAFRRDADGIGALADDLEDALPREGAAEPREEDVRLAGAARKCRARLST